jgi:predicted MFS family arabinose efflux permease
VIATSPTPLGVPGASDATALFILLTIGASRVAGPAASGVSADRLNRRVTRIKLDYVQAFVARAGPPLLPAPRLSARRVGRAR